MEKGWCFQANVDRWIDHVTIKNWDRLEMAGYGGSDYKSTSRGKKAQDQIPPTEANQGTKRSILVDGKGVPLAVSVDGANRHDMKMTKATLQSIVIFRPEPPIRLKRARVP